MGVDWSGPSNTALQRPLEETLAIIYTTHVLVVVLFGLTAAVSGALILWYSRLDYLQKSSIWLYYGNLAVLACVGSVFGSVAWIARMQDTVYGFRALTAGDNESQSHTYRLFSTSRYWGAVFYFLYPVEFFCTCVAKLLVLERMVEFISKSLSDRQKHLVLIGRRVLVAIVVVGNVVLGGSLAAAAVYYMRIAAIYSDASDSFDAGDTASALSYLNNTFAAYDMGDRSLSIQNACESIVLVFIVAVFSLGGLLVVRQLRNLIGVIDSVHGSHDALANFGRSLHKKIITTVLVVFLTFIVRASFALMLSVGDSAPFDSGCGRCETCQSQVRHSPLNCLKASASRPLTRCPQNSILSSFLFLSPEVRTSVILVSSPFSLLVVLWGMTSSRMKDMMLKKRRQVGAVSGLDATSLLGGSSYSAGIAHDASGSRHWSSWSKRGATS